MKHVTIFDQPYPDDKQFEGLGVSWAFVSGACNKCGYLKKCENDDSFVFPDDAPCMGRKRDLMKEAQQ